MNISQYNQSLSNVEKFCFILDNKPRLHMVTLEIVSINLPVLYFPVGSPTQYKYNLNDAFF